MPRSKQLLLSETCANYFKSGCTVTGRGTNRNRLILNLSGLLHLLHQTSRECSSLPASCHVDGPSRWRNPEHREASNVECRRISDDQSISSVRCVVSLDEADHGVWRACEFTHHATDSQVSVTFQDSWMVALRREVSWATGCGWTTKAGPEKNWKDISDKQNISNYKKDIKFIKHVERCSKWINE